MSAAVSPLHPPSVPVSPVERIQRLQADARIAAAAHVGVLVDTLNQVASLSADVAGFGDLVPIGVRELTSRLADSEGKHALTITALMDRA